MWLQSHSVGGAWLKPFNAEAGMAAEAPRVATLELRDVAKSFGPVAARRSAGITVEAGSVHALVGENGAGKSALINIVAGVLRRHAGEYLLEVNILDVRWV